jgi:hypothetical protein
MYSSPRAAGAIQLKLGGYFSNYISAPIAYWKKSVTRYRLQRFIDEYA